ncbi:MAG: (Fe-S)-binding protein [Chloroflexi bacterium]|nr:(Fe-S)-binding protein [Chloroflexota bacterium]MYF79034.1 (Fe-S)-binding protein [Chloroflexota bacterium]MYK60912.1 (Fe-S)-binding protein [Chloroflexota bacterium]
MKSTHKPSERGFITDDAPSEDDLYKCVQCGFCLNACPTYLETGLEAESPRGRLTLMKAVNEGRVEMTPTVTRHWDLCLQCRACEVACPSGVPYGRIMMATRAEMKSRVKRPLRERLAREVGFNRLLPKPKLMRTFGKMTRFYQRSGARDITKRIGVMKALPKRYTYLDESLPTMGTNFFEADGRVVKPKGRIKARVSLLGGCVMSMMHADTMNATLRVLVHNGFEVHLPAEQGCCGSLNMYAGERATAGEMAANNTSALLSMNPDAVVSSSAGCGSTMKEYGELLDGDHMAEELASKTRDIHELLAEYGWSAPSGRMNAKIVFQDPCHLLSTQRISDPPREILKSIPGVELVDMDEPTVCCGSAGTYSISQRDMSMRLGDRKARNIVATGAAYMATGNPGCALQLTNALGRAEADVKVRYVVDLLDEAYRTGGDYN